MLNAAMVLGIIGGTIGMIVGLFGFGFAELWSWMAEQAGEVDVRTGLSFSEEVGSPQDPIVTKIISLLAPILGLSGGAMAPSNPQTATALMALSAGGMMWGFGFGVFTMFPIALCAVGALLAFIGAFTRGPRTGPR
jgi:hypothetical protein